MPFDPSIMQQQPLPAPDSIPLGRNNLMAMAPQVSDPVQESQQQVQQPGGLKGMLKGFLWGMSRGMMAHAGIESPEQQQLKQQALDIQQQQANTQEGYRQFQQQLGEKQFDLQKSSVMTPYGMMPLALAQKAFPAMINAQAKTDVQGMKGDQTQAILNSQENRNSANNDTKIKIAQLSAQNKLQRLSVAPGGGISALTPQEKNALVDGLIDGTLDVRSFGRMSGPQRMQLLAAAKMKDPSFDQTRFTARQSTMTDFYKGKAADQIKSFRAFLGHAEDLSDFSDDFQRTDSRLANKPLMWLRQNASSDPNVAAYLAKIDPVKKEFESFLLNNRALYESDRKTADLILSENMPASQMKSAIQSFVHTAAIRMKTVNQQYKDANGGKDSPTLYDPDTKRILGKFGQSVEGGSGNAPRQGGNSGFWGSVPGAVPRQ